MLYYNTITNTLKEVLSILMKHPLFKDFRLVGGTALSLQVGHRMSIDIDLFTDNPYSTVDFD
ncbi:nucleotidyl transferase AbiEii/AbiGii toxin family protein [Myroides profundi]|uniref:Nucleotidyl transferase AbiEii toxin, Type IV TA system n=1 Tax=Myroides profundi TaxID=480520 RepID=A0AAJ4W4Y1_MYRPR|nr:nucleotidyl transferase AbiEii/AbiGii toxin family protein [Myroides profundi]SER15538.1 Nucleotidyl transferase AbiEii toxin, Type IV TA system [Myroides profundi]